MRPKYVIRRLEKIPHQDFLMHGSHRRLHSPFLMPKKPKTTFRLSAALLKKRVYATPIIAVALLYATLQGDDSAWDWCFMRKDGELGLYCRVKKEPLIFMPGYIHIMPKKGFQNRGSGVVFSSRHRARVVERIRIPGRVITWLIEQKEVHFVRRVPETDESLCNPKFRRVSRAR
jgi:hypothetical protein